MNKDCMKSLVFWISVLLMTPFITTYYLLCFLVEKDSVFSGFSQLLCLIPGKTGIYLRSGFYHYVLTFSAQNVHICFLTLLSHQDTEIYGSVYIGPQCNIGKCLIKKNTLIGSGVHIMSGKNQHNFDNLNMPINEQGGVFEKIEIGEDCWIGNGALILANIGDHCIIGSGSVVIHDIPENSIVAGNPAKVIKSR